jgi:5-methyltetrahydrofolate--homocysteine methyltransferase
MNRIFAETHGVAGDLAAINRAGVRLARQAATGRVVLGDMSSTGQLLEPYGGYSEAQFEDAFREQAVWLAEAGVDGFIIETITDLREGRCALRACAGLGPPAVLSMALANLNDGGRTMMGDRVGDCAATAEADGAAAFGLNCGDLEPAEMARTVAAARNRTRLSIIAQPNAGRPRLVSDKTVFDLGPDGFAAGGRLCAEADAAVVGGCCGTTPDHIRALAQALRRD